MLDKYYQPDLVEEKIYKQWEEDGDFNAPVDSKNKHYSTYTLKSWFDIIIFSAPKAPKKEMSKIMVH